MYKSRNMQLIYVTKTSFHSYLTFKTDLNVTILLRVCRYSAQILRILFFLLKIGV